TITRSISKPSWKSDTCTKKSITSCVANTIDCSRFSRFRSNCSKNLAANAKAEQRRVYNREESKVQFAINCPAAACGRNWFVHRIASASIDWKAIREDFPILRERAHGHPLIYFDNAATTQKPRSVLDVLRNYYEHDNANVHRGLHALSTRATEAYERSRKRVGEYIGAANADEIVFTRGTTESINLVAQAWGGKFLREGDVI